MNLRHIQPGSLEWHDAVEDEAAAVARRPDPVEVKKLRLVAATEKVASHLTRTAGPDDAKPAPRR